ncbi:MAG TPA: arylsulfatase [Candidatus Hydrogenedentes bacterium]|nr:arylsulfatase [Candidatus Hydrogenedentota bacterium]
MTRREFIGAGAGALAAAALQGRGHPAPHSTGKAPNIVVILADDMGFSDIGCYGAEINTPHLDRLAANGLRFTQAYSAARCCPTRAALLTGLNPHQTGVGGMVSRIQDPPPPEGPYQGYLNDQCVTIAEALRPAGYSTYMSGKWHVGERPEHWPRRRGFDRYYGLVSGASSYFEILPEERKTRVMARDDERIFPEGDDFYMTDAFSDFAVECIGEHNTERPFFLYLAYTAPHWPLHALPEDIAKYRGKYRIGWDRLREERYARLVEMGIIDPRWRLAPRDPDCPPWDDCDDKDEMDLRMAVYAAMIDRMDQGIGRVMDALRRRGMEENTLVLFMSDNGGCHENIDGRRLHKPGTRAGERGSFVAYERPWANASNTPFRLFKHWVHEGGIASPLVAHWPAGIQQRGELTHQVMHVTDIMATCLDLAGAQYPETFGGKPITPLVGRSLAPIFRGEAREPHERLYWEHLGNKALREGNWKLVASKTGDWELYDLEADRTELRDLSEKEPDRAAAMLRAWKAWADATGVRYAT